MPANPDTPINCPLWHLLNIMDVSIANAEEERDYILQDAESAKARGLDAESLRPRYHKACGEVSAMHRLRAWVVENAESGKLTLDNGIHLDMLQA